MVELRRPEPDRLAYTTVATLTVHDDRSWTTTGAAALSTPPWRSSTRAEAVGSTSPTTQPAGPGTYPTCTARATWRLSW